LTSSTARRATYGLLSARTAASARWRAPSSNIGDDLGKPTVNGAPAGRIDARGEQWMGEPDTVAVDLDKAYALGVLDQAVAIGVIGTHHELSTASSATST
jgi:hypothetical protein